MKSAQFKSRSFKMKFIQTLYFNEGIDPFKHNFGWCAPEFHLMGWVLSCLQLKEIYGNVDLYCNSRVASLLRDEVGLPYTNYLVTHDKLDIVNRELWALPKIYTYSLQTSPFLHLDGDVFLFKKLPDELLNSGLIAQNMEVATEYYTSAQKKIMTHFTYFPDCVNADFISSEPIKAVNAGILGGQDTAFFKDYSNEALIYVYNNKNNLSDIVPERFNVFFEQHLFYSLAKERNLNIDYLFTGTIKDNQYQNLSDFHETPFHKYYLHLLGHYKKDRYTCIKMAEKLRELHPEYYYKIIAMCKKQQVFLFSKTYNNNKNNSVADFIDFSNNAKLIYNGILGIKPSELEKGGGFGVSSINDIKIVQNYIDEISENSKCYSIKIFLQKDFTKFLKNLNDSLKWNDQFSLKYLYGRDLESAKWYRELFEDEIEIQNKHISKCCEIQIIESSFDWAGLINKINRIAVRYYEDMELKEGCFYNLLIPEVTTSEISFYDLDELEKIILDNLSETLTIKKLMSKMNDFVEEDILNNHLDEYYNLILVFIKALVLKRAIKPCTVNFSNSLLSNRVEQV